MNFDPPDESAEPIRRLTRPQRRVIGVLVEKALTTPDSYPLTLKGLTNGCNQKSNRSPVTQYSEDTILDTLEELRELGLVGEVYTDGGRAAKYRHYMRKRFDFTEPQLAIVIELMLRGRQQAGELRARASRMVTIEGLADLRRELGGLLEQGFVCASAALERRGVEVDHNFYMDSENKPDFNAVSAKPAAEPSEPNHAAADVGEAGVDIRHLVAQVETLAERVRELEQQLDVVARHAGITL